jgi:predicted esterase
MSDVTFPQLAAEYFRLCESGAYAEARDLVRRGAALFPNRHLYYNWLLCAATGMSAADGLQELSEAIASGYWFDEAVLREDPDLQPLQGLPEFERLIAIGSERRAAAEAQAVPELLTLLPDAREPYPLLVALHGAANSIAASVDLWRPAVRQGWLLAVPQSSQVFEPGQYTWGDRDRAAREVQGHVAALRGGYPIDEGRLVVGGFSMGGGLAIELTASGAVPARGFMVVGPFLPDIERLGTLLAERQGPAPRGYIVVGERDHGIETIERIIEVLQAHSVPLEVERHRDLDHRFPIDFDRSLTRALEFICRPG